MPALAKHLCRRDARHFFDGPIPDDDPVVLVDGQGGIRQEIDGVGQLPLAFPLRLLRLYAIGYIEKNTDDARGFSLNVVERAFIENGMAWLSGGGGHQVVVDLNAGVAHEFHVLLAAALREFAGPDIRHRFSTHFLQADAGQFFERRIAAKVMPLHILVINGGGRGGEQRVEEPGVMIAHQLGPFFVGDVDQRALDAGGRLALGYRPADHADPPGVPAFRKHAEFALLGDVAERVIQHLEPPLHIVRVKELVDTVADHFLGGVAE